MDHDALVRRASNGDVRAFVELTQRFQHFAFGSALTLLQDFQRAEDVVQEAFVAAWSALPTLDDSAAFPGWLRTIVRHHALRVLRRKQLEAVPRIDATFRWARQKHRSNHYRIREAKPPIRGQSRRHQNIERSRIRTRNGGSK